MPSLKDLAKECGVSVATVSKALNDQPDISPATRERVRAAAHRMGYLPNAAARSLKTNRTYNLGVLFVDERQSGLTHEYFSAVLDSFKVEAEKHGYDITFINHNISGKSMSYLEHCRYRNVDGVVIACVNFYEPQVVELVNSEVPVVTIDHVFNNRMAILSDNVFGLKALVRQAWACGHRRIAFIHGEKTAVTENRVAGFYQACEELGLKIPEALNDQPDISPATRERVRAAAHRMGYLPNAAARSLKTNRTYNLGVLFVDERQSGLTHEYFSAVLDSFKVEAEKHGYDITFINHNISGKSMSYLEHCRYRNVDGVVIACVNFYEPQVVELVNSEVPVVTIDHVFNNRMAILSDNVFGLKALVRQAWACGHRRIAFIHGEKTAVTENRVAGFYQACEELGLKIPEAYVREGIYHDADRCAAETKALLELPQPPTCIIFPDDFSALGGYNAISEKGLSIPEDVSVMGYDGIYLSRVVKPQLVTYQQNTTALGRTAADKLIELIEHPRVTLPEQIRVSGKLLDGGSVSIL